MIDPRALLSGDCVPLAPSLLAERHALVAARRSRIEARKLQIAATSVLDNETDAEYGVVPLAVHRRATLPWRS